MSSHQEKNIKLAFVYPHNASFINLEIKILSEKFNVIENVYNWKQKSLVPLFLIKQLFFFLRNWQKFDHILISFGGWWSIVPIFIGKISGTKTSLILHGTDTCYIPELNYGNLGKFALKKVLGYSYRNASLLLPVSEALIRTKLDYFKTSTPSQGVLAFYPNLKTPFKIIPNGIDSKLWPYNDDIRIDKQFVTVLSAGQFTLKGGHTIIKMAAKRPDLQFHFVGITANQHSFDGTIPSNVYFHGRKTPEELKNIYYRSKYYLQLSLWEGFGIALCEAMSCGCIPIVSNTNALPNIIGDSGYVLKTNNEVDIDLLLNTIENEQNQKKQLLASNRIKENFSIENRKKLLTETIMHLVK